jgi:Spy/CpxP family protein refolding chaperone
MKTSWKDTLAMSLAAVLIFGAGATVGSRWVPDAWAQDPGAAPALQGRRGPGPHAGATRGMGPGHGPMVERFFERMTEELALTPDQQARIRALHAEHQPAIQAAREACEAGIHPLREALRAQVMEELTPEQRAHADALREEHQNRRGGRMRRWHGTP